MPVVYQERALISATIQPFTYPLPALGPHTVCPLLRSSDLLIDGVTCTGDPGLLVLLLPPIFIGVQLRGSLLEKVLSSVVYKGHSPPLESYRLNPTA